MFNFISLTVYRLGKRLIKKLMDSPSR